MNDGGTVEALWLNVYMMLPRPFCGGLKALMRSFLTDITCMHMSNTQLKDRRQKESATESSFLLHDLHHSSKKNSNWIIDPFAQLLHRIFRTRSLTKGQMRANIAVIHVFFSRLLLG